MVEKISLIADLLKRFNDLTSIEDIYGRIAETIATSLGIDKCVIAMVNEKNKTIEAKPPGYGSTVDKILNFKFPLNANSAFSYISKNKESYYTNDAYHDPLFMHKFIEYFDVKKVIIAPLIARGKVIGAIYGTDLIDGGDLTDEDKAVFDSIGEITALSISNYQLLKKNEEQLNLLENIRKISNNITSILDYDILLPTILQRVKSLFNADAVSIMSFDKNSSELFIKSSVGLSYGYTKGQKIDISKIDKSQFSVPKIVNNLQKEYFGSLKLIREEGLFSVLIVPLRVYNDFVGVLNIYSKEESRKFDKDDVDKAYVISTSVGIAIKNANMFTEMEETIIDVVSAISKIVEVKDKYTEKHSESVAEIAVSIGRRLNMQREELNNLYIAGLLHDIGKISIPDTILQKPAKLTKEEMDVIKKHPRIGAEIIGHIRKLKPAREAILHHHERFDGKGYPDGKKGKESPLIARILSIADAFEAMTSDRPYHKSMQRDTAIKELLRNKGTQFDPELVDILTDIINEKNLNI